MKKLALDLELLKRLVEKEQLTQAAIAVRFGCSVSCIERTIARLGLRTQRTGPRSGPLHPDWKGGRTLIGGYWYIWTNTHPYRTQRNYVLEHRLVAEATLERYLSPEEVVHHINGDSEDNRPENLQVFGTNAEHLRHELTGKIPNWTPEGWANMKAAAHKKHIAALEKGFDDSERIQTTDH